MPRQKNRTLGVLSSIVGMVGFSALAGILVTAIVTPALAVTSMAANSSIGIFEALPEYLEIGTLAQKNTLWGLRGDTYVPFAQVYKHNREEVSWEQVSPLIKQAVVAGEDRRFYEHGGVDLQGIIRAATQNIASSEISSGGSTLAMQLVKNIYIQRALLLPTKAERDSGIAEAQAQTLDRKLREAKLAIGLEKNYTKNQILLAYLNITGFGGNTYGIQSAAKEYYGTTADNVTLAQAASLVAIVQSPNTRNLNNPDKYPENQKRRHYILSSMLELKMITQSEFDEADNTPVEDYVDYHNPTSGCTHAANAKSFCDYILHSVKDLEMLGVTPQERQANWDRGGYNVYTTIDFNQQDYAQSQLNAQTPPTEPRFKLGSSAVSTQVGTGRILVMAQNKIFDDTGEGDPWTTTAVNYSTDIDYGGSSGFQTGSTYKIFALTDWLIQGHSLGDVVDGDQREYKNFRDHCSPGGIQVGDVWKPKNDSFSDAGPISVMSALVRSINNAFVSIEEQLDLCDIRNVAMSMGVHRADGKELQRNPTAVLGTNELAPLTMAAAVATIAGGGVYCKPIAVDYIVGPDGTNLGGQQPSCSQAFSPEVAAGVAYAMAGVVNGGTGVGSNPRNGYPLIGKTGTTDGSIQTWMVGSTSKVSLAVWVGNISGHQKLAWINILGAGNGSYARHRIFLPTMAALSSSYGGDAFPKPPAYMLSANVQAIPSVAGMDPVDAQTLLESLGFKVKLSDQTKPSSQTIGTVGTSSPAAGAKLSRGYLVTLYTSDGTLYVQMPTDIIGQNVNSAKSELMSLGWASNKVGITWVLDPNPANHCVVSAVTPGEGQGADKSLAVYLTAGSDTAGQPPLLGCGP